MSAYDALRVASRSDEMMIFWVQYGDVHNLQKQRVRLLKSL